MLSAPVSPIDIPATGREGSTLSPLHCQALALLTDGLLHDARNPLNALSIHLEVLTERLRREGGGSVPQMYERNLRAIRDQVQRVDSILRTFADFIAPRPASVEGEALDFSAIVERAITVVGHEARKRRLTLDVAIEPSVRVRAIDREALHELALMPWVWAVARSAPGSKIHGRMAREGEGPAQQLVMRLELESGAEFDPRAVDALCSLAQRHSGRVRAAMGWLEVRLPCI